MQHWKSCSESKHCSLNRMKLQSTKSLNSLHSVTTTTPRWIWSMELIQIQFFLPILWTLPYLSATLAAADKVNNVEDLLSHDAPQKLFIQRGVNHITTDYNSISRKILLYIKPLARHFSNPLMYTPTRQSYKLIPWKRRTASRYFQSRVRDPAIDFYHQCPRLSIKVSWSWMMMFT